MSATAAPGTESGDRASFLARLRAGRVEHPHHNAAHPLPAPNDGIPIVVSHQLDEQDITGSFCRNAAAVKVHVHRAADRSAMADAVAAIVASTGATTAVASGQPLAVEVADLLRGLGVEVRPISVENSSRADLGVTVACGAIATTGTIVQRSDEVGGRTGSLLVTTHLVIVPADDIVASSAQMIRRFGDRPMPSNVVLVTGPSKSGDIEQIIVTGVHGPLTVEAIVV